MSELKNSQGGIEVKEEKALQRAEKADLVTLPPDVKGTNCGNCKFAKSLKSKEDALLCNHPEVLLPVTNRMCCAFWDAKKTLRAWKKD